MQQTMTSAQQMRCVALEAAGRIAESGMSTSGLLSRAYQCETYLVTGLLRSGPKWLSAVEVGSEGVSVLVESEGLTEVQATRVREAVRAVLV